MYTEVDHRIKRLADDGPVEALLADRRVGLEREALRVAEDGTISRLDHPRALGAALSHPYITTDFSEALLEMVTPPMPSSADALSWLAGIHRYVAEHLPSGERFWPGSMPCILKGDDSIRVGEYGHSHNGRMKRIYRLGLAQRYGKRMQVIAGIHFNFSMPEACWDQWALLHEHQASGGWSDGLLKMGMSGEQARVTAGYFHMARNLMRIGWIVPYLFGVSPAICRSFLSPGEGADLSTLGDNTLFAPDGTSLRMGNIGYSYRKEHGLELHVRHDSFEHYLEDLRRLVTQEHPAWQALGVHDQQGERQQLNAHYLQIENEYYSSVRPKQITRAGEMPLLAMERRGIRYLELRSLDIDPYAPCGMTLPQLRFLELLMVFTWLADSPPLSDDELSCTRRNIESVAHDGRRPGLMLDCARQQVIALKDWGEAVLERLVPLAEALDRAQDGRPYADAVKLAASRLADPEMTPSARALADIREHGSYYHFTAARSHKMHEEVMNLPLQAALRETLDEEAHASLARQLELESVAEDSDFETWLSDYFSQLEPQAEVPV